MNAEHKKLLRLWAQGKATRKQIMRCMELDRKCKIWPKCDCIAQGRKSDCMNQHESAS